MTYRSTHDPRLTELLAVHEDGMVVAFLVCKGHRDAWVRQHTEDWKTKRKEAALVDGIVPELTGWQEVRPVVGGANADAWCFACVAVRKADGAVDRVTPVTRISAPVVVR